MEQSSAEWLSWRQKGIGASDSPILLGLSKRTRYELWLEKTGRAPAHSIPTFAKAKGGEIEAQLRARHSLIVGLNFEPACASHDEYAYLICSYDGIAMEGDKLRAIEIKFVGKDIYEAGEVKEAHKVQCQHQMMVMDLEYVDYLMSVDGVEYKAIRIYPDPVAWKRIFEACQEFNEFLVKDIAPPLSEDDWWPATPEIEALLKGPLDEDARNKLKKIMPHKQMIGSAFKAQIDKRGALRISAIKL